jgi:NTE family protein
MTAITRKDVATFSPGVVLGPLARSLLQERPFRETLEALVPARTFAELAIPLTVTAVDAQSGDLVLFGAGGRSHVPLIDALYATCALPVYYPAAKIGDREFTDGGVRAVFPLDVAGDFGPGTVIGVNVGPSRYDQAQPVGLGAKGIVAAHRRAMRIMMAIQIEQTIARWRDDPPVDCILVEPPVTRAGTFAIDRVIEYVEQGYRATIRALAH